MNSTTKNSLRELDSRTNEGIDVRLLWDSLTDRVWVDVDDSRSQESFTFPVAAADSLGAFHHPFAYAFTFELAEREGSKIAILPWD